MRNIQLYNCYDPNDSDLVHTVLEEALRLSNICSLTIAQDVLADSDDDEIYVRLPHHECSMFIDDVAEDMQLDEATCVGIGRGNYLLRWTR